jgi:mono/diheme cytochrome c family protein
MRLAATVSASVATVAVLTLSACGASGPLRLADGSAASKVNRPAVGSELYRSYCLNCHGEDGKGDGPIAGLLNVLTKDLTTIALRNDGEFPAELVYQQIDGTEYLAPHGTGLMPVWGVVLNPDFQLGGDQDGAEVADRQIRALVEYLRTIQE